MTWVVPLLPFLAPAVGAMVSLLVQAFAPKAKGLNTALAVLFLMGGIIGAVRGFGSLNVIQLFDGILQPDQMFCYLSAISLTAGIVTVIVAQPYLERAGLPIGEFNSLVGFAVAGGTLMAGANDLLSIFIGLEVLSISVYILVGMRRTSVRAAEGALKYFLLGAFASSIFLYGIAIMYGTTGSLLLPAIKDYFVRHPDPMILTYVAAGFMLAGMAFKLAAFPFHMWAPDAYEGAPVPVVGFMAVAVKVAAMGALLRIIYGGLWPIPALWQQPLAAVAVGTMVVGNLFALVQTNIKRLMAYSSMAHTGYMFIGLATLDLAGPAGSAPAILYYLAAYGLTTLATFACFSYLCSDHEAVQDVQQLNGLGRRYPLVSAVLTVGMLSLAGLPPTAGFFAKYTLFAAAIANGHWGLAVIGILMSLLSLAYYLRVVVALWLRQGEQEITSREGFGAVKALACYLGVAILWLGISGQSIPLLPGIRPMLDWAHKSIVGLLA